MVWPLFLWQLLDFLGHRPSDWFLPVSFCMSLSLPPSSAGSRATIRDPSIRSNHVRDRDVMQTECVVSFEGKRSHELDH